MYWILESRFFNDERKKYYKNMINAENDKNTLFEINYMLNPIHEIINVSGIIKKIFKI